jgi:hypothetical protein
LNVAKTPQYVVVLRLRYTIYSVVIHFDLSLRFVLDFSVKRVARGKGAKEIATRYPIDVPSAHPSSPAPLLPRSPVLPIPCTSATG